MFEIEQLLNQYNSFKITDNTEPHLYVIDLTFDCVHFFTCHEEKEKTPGCLAASVYIQQDGRTRSPNDNDYAASVRFLWHKLQTGALRHACF